MNRGALRGCLKSLHGFLQRYPHAMVIVDFRELRTIVTSSEAALHQLNTLMSGLLKQPLKKTQRGLSTPEAGGVHETRLTLASFRPSMRLTADCRGKPHTLTYASDHLHCRSRAEGYLALH